jgi:hypothetical protein
LRCCHAKAFIDPPVFSPALVLENQPFSVSYRNGVCDGFPFSGFPTDIFRVAPNRLQIFVTGVHITDPIFCIQGIGNPSFALPALPAGDYQLELYIRNRANPFRPIHDGPVAPFRVAGAPTVTQIPTLNMGGWLLMLLGILATTGLSTRLGAHYK